MSACPPHTGAGAGPDDWRLELRREYAQALPDKFADIERRLREWTQAPDDRARLLALLAEVHRLHGSAGSYGFAELSRLAGEWEEQLARLRDGGSTPGPTAFAHMAARLHALRRLDGLETDCGAPPPSSS